MRYTFNLNRLSVASCCCLSCPPPLQRPHLPLLTRPAVAVASTLVAAVAASAAAATTPPTPVTSISAEKMPLVVPSYFLA